MARAALLALAWCSVRGEQYAGAVMPQYGADYARAPSLLDDYRGHAPDAPASLDYKYEEDPPLPAENKKPMKNDDDEDPWREEPVRAPKRSARVDITKRLELDEPETEAPQPDIRRRQRRRPRARRAKSRRDERPRNRYKEDDERAAQYFDNVDYPDNRGKYLDGTELVEARETTVRIIKRKPRDRIFAPPPPPPLPSRGDTRDVPDDREAEDDEPESRRLKESKFNDPEEWSKPASKGYRPLIAEETSATEGNPKYSSYQDYGDYYDLKKVIDIKNKLPTLLRRTKTTPDVIRMPPARPKPDLMSALWPSRRAGGQPFTRPPLQHEEKSTGKPLPSPSRRSQTRITDASADDSIDRTRYTVDVGAEVTTTTAAAPDIDAPSPADQSLAEKSRLSILKKARLKESVKLMVTKKPPVLLHVTSHLPTVVMVEPATSVNPWMRAREVVDDSPETIDKVKRMMRQKLVASAKSIGELTDDWDQIVCDYVDIGMLAADSAPPTAPLSSILHLLLTTAIAGLAALALRPL